MKKKKVKRYYLKFGINDDVLVLNENQLKKGSITGIDIVEKIVLYQVTFLKNESKFYTEDEIIFPNEDKCKLLR